MRILYLEDSLDDFELIRATLDREGLKCSLARVETEKDFIAAIEKCGVDLILSDYLLPSFNGLSALETAKERCPEIPFIFVTGAMGEELAIETLKRGATDYILKNRLSKLALAVKRALKEAEDRTNRRKADQALKRSRDELERRRLEEERQKVRKLESIGILAGGIAHDFNNLLHLIVGNIFLARTALNPGDPAFETLNAAEDACERAKELSDQLITFAEGGAPIKKTISLSSFLKEGVTSSLYGSNILAEFNFLEDIHAVEIDERQITRVIHNIITNAREAMPYGGSLRVHARNVVVTDSDSAKLPLKAGAYVKVSFEDQGIGIPEENLGKVFDPYFTTKKMGAEKGRGLGLAICHSIMKRHGGMITVESTEDAGTTFHMYLPASRESVRAEKT